jgi:predicted ABC-type ATPase
MRDDRRGSLDARADDTSTDARRPEAVDRPGPTRSPDPLRQRLDQLPPGHPSSPYETDGGRRGTAPRLADLDRVSERSESEPFKPGKTHRGSDSSTTDARQPVDQSHLLTDAEWTEHVVEVRACLEKAFGDGLATDVLYTIDGAGEIWTDERLEIHNSILEEMLARSADVPCEGKAIIAGGLGGAGKSTVLENHAGIDRSRYVTINPDDIKKELAQKGLVPEVEGLTPMEAAGLAHEEASYIAKQLAARVQAEGKNIIWDITMSSKAKVETRVDELRSAGYQHIEGVFVDIPVEVSISRADYRHREDHEKYRAGEGIGGRLVPEEVTRAQADEDWGSKNRRAFEEVKGNFDHWSLYNNSVDGRAPLLVESSTSNDADSREMP